MDAKITKNRISDMLSYDWLKIVGVALALVLFWSLLFTLTATRITNAQQFVVFNHYANNRLTTGYENHLRDSLTGGKFSYEILEADTRDLTTAGDEKYTVANTCFETGEGDMIFVPNVTDKDVFTTDADGQKNYPLTYAESFFAMYHKYVVNVETFLAETEEYLRGYFGEDYENGVLDEAKVETDFRARVEGSGDDRFRRESQIAQGVIDEKARLMKYRDGLAQMREYLADGVVAFEEVALKDENGEVRRLNNGSPIKQGAYALNICPTSSATSATSKMKNLVSYTYTTESGASDSTAADMCVMLLDTDEENVLFRFETILYVNALVETALA